MEWMFWPITVENHLPVCHGCAQPTAVDLAVIRILYEFMASETTCSRCRSPLRPAVLLIPDPYAIPTSWSISVTTRCAGWRRHLHTATAFEANQDLLLGSFRP